MYTLSTIIPFVSTQNDKFVLEYNKLISNAKKNNNNIDNTVIIIIMKAMVLFYRRNFEQLINN